MVLRNLTAIEIEESIAEMKKCIDESNIIMIPADSAPVMSSGKFIATVFRNPYLAKRSWIFEKRAGYTEDTGFQALVGLLPYGEIRPLDKHATLL